MEEHGQTAAPQDSRPEQSTSPAVADAPARSRFKVKRVAVHSTAHDVGFECSGSQCSCGD